jgi:hypothetical protein
MIAIRAAIAKLIEDGDGTVTPSERVATIVKAWNTWSSNKRLNAQALELEYTEDEDGEEVLSETPILGGIDIGNP